MKFTSISKDSFSLKKLDHSQDSTDKFLLNNRSSIGSKANAYPKLVYTGNKRQPGSNINIGPPLLK
jgi:hypothetical protein